MTALAVVPRETMPALEHIELDLVDIGDNVRDEVGDLTELAASIEELGVQQPIKVTHQPTGRYRLVFGQRRVLASRQAGLTTILAIVEEAGAIDEPGARRSIEQLAENLQRKDLNPIEEAVALREVLEADPSLTQAELARRLGVSPPWVSNTLNLLDVAPKVQELVRTEQLSASHVKALRGLTPKDQADLAQRAVASGYSAHALEDTVKSWRQSESWRAQMATHDAEHRKTIKANRQASLARLVERAAPSDPVRVCGWGDIAPIVKLIEAAGFTDVATTSNYMSGVARRSETGCDCVAWRVEETGAGNLTIAEACLDESHQQAALAKSRAGDEARQELVKSAQASLRESVRLSIGLLPRSVRQALVWHAMDYTALDWVKEQRKAAKDRKLDPWTALTRLSDEELNGMLADHVSRQFRDRYGLSLDWTAVGRDLLGADEPATPAPKKAAPTFSAKAVAAARAELDLDGAD